MATGGGSFSHSVLKASDEIHDYSCSPCSKNGHNSEAIYKCVECKTFLCAKCRDGHNQFVIGHKVVDVRARDIGGGLIYLKGYTCEEHPNKLIEMYCKTHDEVYCAVCLLQHRSCTGVDYIPDIAKTLLENQDKESVETELKQQCVELQKLKHSRLKYLSKLSEEKVKNDRNIKRFKEELIKKAEEMETSLLVEVEKKYKAMTNVVNIEVEKIDHLINDAEKYLSKIFADKYDDDKDEVVTFKLSEHQVIAANRQILDLAWKKEERIDFQRSTTFEKCLGETRLGNLNISSRSRNTVKMYNADETEGFHFTYRIERYIQPRLTDVGIHSKVIEDLGVINAGDLYVCVVSEIPGFEELVHDLNKGNVKKSRRYKVLVVCLVLRELKILFRRNIRPADACPITHASSRKLCKDNNLPYICVDYFYSDFSDAVKVIRKTVDE